MCCLRNLWNYFFWIAEEKGDPVCFWYVVSCHLSPIESRIKLMQDNGIFWLACFEKLLKSWLKFYHAKVKIAKNQMLFKYITWVRGNNWCFSQDLPSMMHYELQGAWLLHEGCECFNNDIGSFKNYPFARSGEQPPSTPLTTSQLKKHARCSSVHQTIEPKSFYLGVGRWWPTTLNIALR